MSDDRIELLRAHVLDVPDFPKPGILFKDITPLLAAPKVFTACLDLFAENWAGDRVDAVIGIESRGFIFGAALAARMSASFVPARKPGKLPREVDRVEYALEYGTDCVELHADALRKGERVLIIDDVIATGGTAAAVLELAKRQHAEVLGFGFVIELDFLNGREKIAGTPVYSLLRY
jgi:adenine phosphoribosyltransferase